MKSIYRTKNTFLIYGLLAVSLLLASCSNDDNPFESESGSAKVAGRISSTTGLAKSTGSQSIFGGVQGATVILAQVQANGSLKTVSTQSIQTDTEGKFVLETKLNGASNLVVVATKGTTEWKAVVSAKVQSESTVYAPPLTSESTIEANIYIKLVSQGHADSFDDAEIKLLLNAQSARNTNGDSKIAEEFMSAFQTVVQARATASSNSYFGLSSSQVQEIAQAKAMAKANFDAALYSSSDTEAEEETCTNNYENNLLNAYSNTSANAYYYAELLRISATAFVNASANMNSQVRMAMAKSFYRRYAFVLNFAMKQQFKIAGASDSQMNGIESAGASLNAAIKSSADFNQMASAFVQYHSSVKSQLQIALPTYASLLESIDASINSTNSAKAVLNTTIGITVNINTIINAYITFYNAIKLITQTTLIGATSAQINSATQILIMANMN